MPIALFLKINNRNLYPRIMVLADSLSSSHAAILLLCPYVVKAARISGFLGSDFSLLNLVEVQLI